tara:strand:- start:1461 stop:2114 length:654 start_codon:yes stop_codon:yes gene_type:complete
MKRNSTSLKLLCILSKIFNGNTDLIEIIYRSKNMIEKNETMLYYLLNGLQRERLYSYKIFTFETSNTIIYESISSENIPDFTLTPGLNCIENVNIYNEPVQEKINDIFLLNKIHQNWEHMITKTLKNEIQWQQKIMIESLFIPNFMFIRVSTGLAWWHRIPTMKEKINSLNLLVKKYGILYLDLIKEDFKNNEYDYNYCILLQEDGEIESIFGALPV